MKLTTKDFIEGEPTLIKVFSYPFEDFKQSYAMAKRSKVVRSESEAVAEARKALIRKHAVMKDGQPIMEENPQKIKEYVFKNQEAFDKEWKEFLKLEIDLDMWPISFPDLEGMKEIVETKDEKEKTKTNKPYLNPLEIGVLIPFLSDLPKEK
jgi:hypothetical protein